MEQRLEELETKLKARSWFTVMAPDYATDEDRRRGKETLAATSWPHVRPDSVYIGAIGNHWSRGAWARVVDMMMYTRMRGYACWLAEGRDRCIWPRDATGRMQSGAAMAALNGGFDYFCMVANDVLPEPDLLVRLLRHNEAIIMPYSVHGGTGEPLHWPAQHRGVGLKRVQAGVYSFVLFRTNVFNCLGTSPWGDANMLDEDLFYQNLWHFGHRPVVDTNAVLELARPPRPPKGDSYTLDEHETTWEEFLGFMERMWYEMNAKPDRGPLGSPDGLYAPFLDDLQQNSPG